MPPAQPRLRPWQQGERALEEENLVCDVPEEGPQVGQDPEWNPTAS